MVNGIRNRGLTRSGFDIAPEAFTWGIVVKEASKKRLLSIFQLVRECVSGSFISKIKVSFEGLFPFLYANEGHDIEDGFQMKRALDGISLLNNFELTEACVLV